MQMEDDKKAKMANLNGVKRVCQKVDDKGISFHWKRPHLAGVKNRTHSDSEIQIFLLFHVVVSFFLLFSL